MQFVIAISVCNRSFFRWKSLLKDSVNLNNISCLSRAINCISGIVYCFFLWKHIKYILVDDKQLLRDWKTEMEQIKIAICDDEKSELERTERILKQYQEVTLCIRTFQSGEALLTCKEQFHVIILDIDMKGINGIEAARQIRQRDKNVKLIYLTNYSDYTTFAFAVHAFAYLLKPVKEDELLFQISEAIEYGIPHPQPKLEFQAEEGIVRIPPSEILFFEYMDRKVLLHTNTKLYHCRKRIHEVAREMEEYHFVMPHKSFVVNLYAVQSIHGYEITLTDGSLIPLSQKKSTAFRMKLNRYLAEERR